MFDAKRLLDAMVSGPAPSPETDRETDRDEGAVRKETGGTSHVSPPSPWADVLRGLSQMWRGPQGGEQRPAEAGVREAGEPAAASREAAGTPPPGQEDIAALFKRFQEQMGPAAGSITETFGKVFGQAAQGAREGAGRIGEAAGLEELIAKMSGGRSSKEVLDQLKAFLARNQFPAGAALGGLGALLFGTKYGRSLATGAAKLGALALIGGLAYKAYQNYRQGKPLITGAETGPEAVPSAAPEGSGFEPAAVSNDTAALYIRAMIAAAAADGRIDPSERGRILAGVRQAGLGSEAEAFVTREIEHPATVDGIAAGVRSSEESVQVYTAARLAIEPDAEAERTFLAKLAAKLGIDEKLTAHIDAAARAAAAA